MPYAKHDDIKIYYEIEGHGPPIILAHGATGNTTFWSGYGYVDRLKEDFLVITFDARGHGRSGKPHEVESYDYHLMVGDIVAILDELGISQTYYWGYSMGGIIGLGFANHYPDRLKAFVAGGATPFGPSNSTEPGPLLKIFRQGINEGADAVVKGMRDWAGSITPQYEERLRELDYRAMATYLEYAQFHRPSLEQAISQTDIPCLFYAGEDDEEAYEYGIRISEQLHKARFFSLPGLGHVGASAAVDLVIPQVLSFLSALKE